MTKCFAHLYNRIKLQTAEAESGWRDAHRPALLTAAPGASAGEDRFYWVLPITEPPVPAAEKQNSRNSAKEQQQQQENALDIVRPQED